MSSLPKILLVLAVVLATAAGVKTYTKGQALQAAQKDVEAAQAQVVSQKAEAAKAAQETKAVQEELKTAQQAKADLEAKLAAGGPSEEAKKALEEAQAQLQAKETELTEVKKQLVSVATDPNQAAPAQQQDPEMAKKLADAEAKAAEQEQLLKALQSKNDEAEQRAAALAAESKRRQAGLARPGLEGRVLAVNPNWNFVVLNVGDRHGVASGASLVVKRGSTLVGKLRITSVEPTTSIADIQGLSARGMSIQPGDVVIFPGS